MPGLNRTFLPRQLLANPIQGHPVEELAANPHICRHTFACRLLERGVDLYTVSKLISHSSIKVTERYAALVKVSVYEQAISGLARGPVLVSSEPASTQSTPCATTTASKQAI